MEVTPLLPAALAYVEWRPWSWLMTGGNGGAQGGEPRPGEPTSAPSRRAELPSDSVPAPEFPGQRPSGKTRHSGTRRRPGPAPAQQELMARISASRKARQRRALLMASGAMSALVLLAASTAWVLTGYLMGQSVRIDAGTTGTPSSGPLNILIAGLDERAGLTPRQQQLLHVGRGTGETNTDTLMLVHVPADHRYVKVVSLPRDSWVAIPGHGMNKINAALGIGGPPLMVRTVEHDTGLTINDFIEVNFLGFVKVIDALHGVNVCLPFPVNDRYSGLHISAGPHHVNGITALMFARDRHSFAASDLARIQDQQQLIASALSEVISSGTLADPARLGRVLSAASAAIKVDRGFNIVSLADELRGISPSQVTFTTVPLASVNYITPNGQSAVRWDRGAASALFTALKNDQLPPRAPAKKPASRPLRRGQVWMDVYNGTLVTGLSADTGTRLAALGFRVASSGLDWTSQDMAQTVIQYPAGQRAGALMVGHVMPGATLQQVNGLPRLRIVLGRSGHAVTAPSAAGQPGSSPGLPPGAPKTAAQAACRNG